MSTARSEHHVLVAGEAIPLTILRHARARRMRLRYDPVAGSLKLTLPPRAPIRPALAWASAQQAWIASQRRVAPDSVRFSNGAVIPVEGRLTAIRWSATAPRTPRLEGDALHVGGPVDRVGERVLRWLKAHARAMLEAETVALAGAHGLPLHSVSIGDPRSRWGSCASSGAIRYSWRLILAPEPVRLATVAHEVAHLVHMHHGPAFHALVKAISLADPDAARAWLRREGAGLHRYSA